MKDKIYYIFFFAALVIVIIAGSLYHMNFPYWLFAIAAFLIIAYLKDVFTGLGWFQKAAAQPTYNPGITESAYQEIVAGYPDLNEAEKNGYTKLSTLCAGGIHQDAKLNNEVAAPKPFWEKSPDSVDLITVGLRSHFVSSYYAAPLLIANGRGLIVNTGHYGAVSYYGGPSQGHRWKPAAVLPGYYGLSS